jgi:hypothetical protein
MEYTFTEHDALGMVLLLFYGVGMKLKGIGYLLAFVMLSGNLLAWEYSIDNTCNDCSRRHLDSLNAFHRNSVRVNQVGYRPQDSRKQAYVANPAVTVFQVVNADNGLEVFSGTLENIGEQPEGSVYIRGVFNSISDVYIFGDTNSTTTETLYRADFSQLSAEGRYKVVVGSDTSFVFRIDDKLYNHVFETALKFFGVQRCGDTDSWIHEPCHLQDGSAVGHDLTGGWHDCGDHFKVSETIGYSAFVLALTYAVWPEKAEDFYGKSYNDTLPFGTDGIPDVLWEAKVGVDYIYKLYKASKANGLVTAGDMYHSVGVDIADHQYWDKPERQDAQPPSKGGPPRVVVSGIGSNVAGMYAAALAFFAWGWLPFDQEYATELGNAAIDIYDNIIMPNLNSTTSGLNGFYPGGGRTDDDEAAAALGLWFLTKQDRFRYDLYENPAINNNTTSQYNQGEFPGGHMGQGRGFHHGGWTTDYEQIHAFVLYGFAKLILSSEAKASEYGITPIVRDSLLQDVVACLATSIRVGSEGPQTIQGSNPNEQISTNPPYNGVFTSFTWGLNRYNMGMVNELFMYWDLTKEQAYFDLAIDNVNYNLGLNPWDISFLMGAGSRNLNHPHNRAANPDGYNAGGIPYEYTCPKGAFMGGAIPGTILKDDFDDFVVTETCIDFSAQLLFPAQMLAKDMPPDTRGPVIFNVKVDQVGENTAIISWQTDELSNDVLFVAESPDGSIVTQVQSEGLSKSKVVFVEGLTKNTQYYFYIQGTDIRRNVSIENNHGEWYSFKTSTTPMPGAQFEGVRICNITHNQATVYWWTPNGNYQSQVEYGTTQALGTQVIGDDSGLPSMFHQVTLKNLSPNTTYYLDVISGTSRDDNSGAHYSFTTTEVLVDYTIMMKGTSKLANSAHFYLEVANNELQPYDGIELRWYFTAPNPAQVTVKGFDNQLYDVTGTPTMASISYGSAVQMAAPYDAYWYIPITYDGTLPVAGRLRVEMEVHSGDWGDLPFENLVGSWSLSAKDSPVKWDGIDLDAVKNFSGTPEYVETINGEKVVTFVRNPYVAAFYNGTHVYGYPPDFESNIPQAHKDVQLRVTAPFESPQTFYESEVFDVNFLGRAWAFPNGNLTHVEVGHLDFGVQEAAINPINARKDSVSYNHSVSPLNYGANPFTMVAWHNRDATDCACAVQRINVEVDTLVAAREKRMIVVEPDTLVAYQGKRAKVKVSLTDESGLLITNEDVSIELDISSLDVQFFIDKESEVQLQRITLIKGEAEFYVYSDVIGVSTLNFTVENPLPQYRYIANKLLIDVQERPPWPLIESAYMIDENCDMIADFLEIELSEEFKSGQAPVLVHLEYGSGYDITVSMANVKAKQLKVPLPANMPVDGNPQGQVTLHMDVAGVPQSHTEDFKEQIGPQVIGVSILEQLSPSQTEDTLYVQFSERIVSPGTSWFLNIFDAAGAPVSATPVVLTSREENVDKNIWMLVVQSKLDGAEQPVQEGVQVQLKQASEATIMDRSKNTQSDCNFTKHTVTTKYRPVPIETGEVWDRDEDGLVETLLLTFTRPLDANHKPDSIALAFGLVMPETLTVSKYQIDEKGTGVTVLFDPPFKLGNTAGSFDGVYKGNEIKNGGLAFQYLGGGAAFESTQKVVFDKAGPVLVDALFKGGSSVDSLEITYSEPLRTVDKENGILLLRKREKEESLEVIFWRLVSDSASGRFYYAEGTPGYTTVGDQVRFGIINSAFTDQNGNKPGKENPHIVVRGSRDFGMEVNIKPVKNIAQVPVSAIQELYGKYPPEPNAPFRVSIINHRSGQEVFIKDGIQDTQNAADSSEVNHIGPTFEIKVALPSGSGRNEAPIWDSVTIHLDCIIYDNLGQFVNRFKESVTVASRALLSLNDEVVLLLEWNAMPGKGPVSQDGRSVGSGAYIGAMHIVTQMQTSSSKAGVTASNYQGLNSKKSSSNRLHFGYIRR